QQQAGGQGAEQDGEEGAGFHQRVTADQLSVVKVLRQDRVLHRTEQRRLGAQGEQGHQHERHAAQPEGQRAEQHQRQLRQLEAADQPVLGVFLAQLAAEGREQEERQDEQQGAEVDQGVGAAADGQLEEDGEDDALLEQVVIEGAQRLGQEVGQK